MIEKNIKELCKARGISVYKLEHDLGLTNGSVSKWGRHTPRADRLRLVANYFGVPLEFLMRKDEDNGPQN